MTIEEINADRIKFIGKAKENIETELTGIAEASAQMFEHVHLGQVTVYGNENTAGNFMAKTAENLNPAFDLLRSIPFADTLKSVLGKKELEEKKAETTEFEEVK